MQKIIPLFLACILIIVSAGCVGSGGSGSEDISCTVDLVPAGDTLLAVVNNVGSTTNTFYLTVDCPHNAGEKYICKHRVYTQCMRYDAQKNYRFSEEDERIMSALRQKMPGKSDSDIIRWSLKNAAIELGVVA